MTTQIPSAWANGTRLTDLEIRQCEAVREAGCECELPLLGHIRGEGPRCRLCGAQSRRPDIPWRLCNKCGRPLTDDNTCSYLRFTTCDPCVRQIRDDLAWLKGTGRYAQ